MYLCTVNQMTTLKYMEKKMYQKPVMRVVNIRTVLLQGASQQVHNVSSGGLFNDEVKPGNGTGGSVARGRQGSVWADDEDWDD